MFCKDRLAVVMLSSNGATWLTWSATLAVPVATARPPARTVLLDRADLSGASLQTVLKLGAPFLSVVALGAAAYFLWRYIRKRRRGEVLST